MLVRRFTIVCLLTALFGMAFASLVAQQGRHRIATDGQATPLCSLIRTFDC